MQNKRLGKFVTLVWFCVLSAVSFAGSFEETSTKAKAGDAEAQFQLGRMYFLGHGVGKDEVEAAKWVRKSAEADNTHAQFNLGLMYTEGHGVSKDDGEAVKWYRKAAEAGNSHAQRNLGVMYA